MATQEQAQALLQQNQALAAELAALRQEMDAMRAAGFGAPRTGIDTKALGKPDHFSGPGWRDWSIVFRSYMAALQPGLSALMEKAEHSEDVVTNAALSPDQIAASTQLYFCLVMICKDSALTRIINAGQNEGLSAWRALCRFHEPTTSARSAALLQEVLAFSFEGELQSRLELFDREVARYEMISKEMVGDNIKIGIVTRQMPDGPLKQHVLLNLDRLDSYAKVRQELEAVHRAQVAALSQTSPMDIHAVNATKGSKGKGRGRGAGVSGKGKEDKGDVVCHHCGRRGHMKRDCWHAQASGGRGKAKGKGKSSTQGPAAPSTQQNGKDNIKCWKCGQKGHLAKGCTKGVASLEKGSGGPTSSATSPAVSGLYLAAITEWAPRLDALGGDAGKHITFGIDSGAAMTCAPMTAAPDYPAVPDKEAGKVYESATGQQVIDEGVSRLVCMQNGKVRIIKTRRAGVTKPLLSVHDMTQQGLRVVFEKDHGFAEVIQTGERIPFVHKNKVWELTMDVVPYKEAEAVLHGLDKTGEKAVSGKGHFGRQAAGP